MQTEQLIVKISSTTLKECSAECQDFLTDRGGRVEPGGVMIGNFDGCIATVRKLLLDRQAVCTPASIHLTPLIFNNAEQLVAQNNRELPEPWFILGTWHGHPRGFSTFSSTDQTMLFREQMRLRTDDPSLALAPWVHFIFENYGLEPERVRAFTMRLNSQFSLRGATLSEQFDDLSYRTIGACVGAEETLGLLMAKAGDERIAAAKYHPDNFELHQCRDATIYGLWRYFPFPMVDHEFEKVFLENFYQKIELRSFTYVRVLKKKEGGILAEPFLCERSNTDLDLSKVISFSELRISVGA